MEHVLQTKSVLPEGRIAAALSGLSPAQRIRLLAGGFLTLAVSAFLLAAGQHLLNDPDTLWHVTVGGDIWRTKSFPHVDAYSHSFAGEPWIAKEWLSQLILYAAYSAGGWNGVVTLTIAVLLVVLMQVYWALSASFKPTYAALIATAVFLVGCGTFLARPHILALPAVLWFAYGTWTAAQRGRAPSFWLLAVLCVWSNMHASFTFGYVAAGLSFLAWLYEHRQLRSAVAYRWIAFLALCPVVSMIHPYGFESIWSTVIIMQNEAVPYISEWRPFSAQKDLWAEITVLGMFSIMAGTRLKLKPVTIIFICLLAHMFLTHIRFLFLFLALTPFLASREIAAQSNLVSFRKWALDTPKEAFENAMAKYAVAGAATFAFVTASVLAGAYMLMNWAPKASYPVAAIQAAKDYGVSGNVMNFYDFGGALIFERVPTFVDGRADRLFQNGFMDKLDATKAADGEATLIQLIEDYDIGWTIYRPEDKRVAILDELPGWRRLYEDEDAVVHVAEKQPR